jgi:hypothetical protein
MRGRLAPAVATVLLVFGLPLTAAAQARPPAPLAPPRPPGPMLPKSFVTGGAGLQLTSSDFTQEIRFDLFQETAQITGPVEIGRPPRFFAGAGFRLHRRFGVGVAVGGTKTTGEMDATYFLPSPFQFNAGRDATATTEASRSTIDLHIQMLALVNHGETWTVILHGGPTVSRISQELATDRFRFEYEFPFSEVVLTEFGRPASTGVGIGGHVGLSMTRRLRGRLGLDTQFLWHSATAELTARDIEGATKQRVQTGGLQLLVGLRYSR